MKVSWFQLIRRFMINICNLTIKIKVEKKNNPEKKREGETLLFHTHRSKKPKGENDNFLTFITELS